MQPFSVTGPSVESKRKAEADSEREGFLNRGLLTRPARPFARPVAVARSVFRVVHRFGGGHVAQGTNALHSIISFRKKL